MKILKKLMPVGMVLILAVLDFLIYGNSHLYDQSRGSENNKKKIETLKRANEFFPFNDQAYYELGKAYFELALDNLSQKNLSDSYLRESIMNFNHSLSLNPASPYTHFHLAQSLQYQTYVSPSSDVPSYEEYKKVALLAGQNSQIYYEVGKVFFSQWPKLSAEDKEFTIEILRKLGKKKEKEKLWVLMEIWEINVKDYRVMEKILTEDPYIYRVYAKFLGEKSLSSSERKNILAKAEFLEFEKAKTEFNLGENDFFYFRVKDAIEHFTRCLEILNEIKFYQNLISKNLIDISEFDNLQKLIHLNLAKCQIAEGASLKEVAKHLRLYLGLEDQVAAVTELESYLKEQGLIEGKLGSNFEDLDRLSFQLELYFKLNRYRDIIQVGDLFQQSFVLIPKENKEAYRKILQVIGDSYQKVDYIYEAEKFYQKALEIDPENMETLAKLRQGYDRLNENEKIREVNEEIDQLLFSREKLVKNLTIEKSQDFNAPLVFDGRKVILEFDFQGSSPEGKKPLVSVFFNNRVVWDDYLKDNALSLALNSSIGENRLQVVAINKELSLEKLSYK